MDLLKKCVVVFIILLLNITTLVKAQETKRNNNWFMAGGDAPVRYQFDSTIFKMTTNVSSSIPYPVFSDGSSIVSDTNGKFLFACNLYFLYDKEGYGITNYDTLNTPLGKEFYNSSSSVDFNQSSLILPKSKNSFYVFTTGMSDLAYDEWQTPPYNMFDARFDVLNYAVVDMDSNNSTGAVVKKNVILMQNAMLSHNRMTAVRHGNGYDWWLIKPHRHRQVYYNFRVTADSIYAPITDSFYYAPDYMWDSTRDNYGIQGQCAFSPDGEWFASTEATNYGCFVYKFDRCNGHFSPYHFYPLPFIDTQYVPNYYGHSVGVCFSPNSHLLYLNTIPDIWQIDIADTSINSPIFITGPDTTLGYFPEYYNGYLAPNGKIYISAWNATRKSMPFIDSPDVRGVGCAFRGRGNGAFIQPYTNISSIANMPFYGLGGNGLCIPASTPTVTSNSDQLVIYPNPSNTSFFIKNKKGKKKEMYNSMGGLLITTWSDEIDVKRFAKGVYYIRCEGKSVRVVVD